MPDEALSPEQRLGRNALYALGGAGVASLADYMVRGKISGWTPVVGAGLGLGANAAINPSDFGITKSPKPADVSPKGSAIPSDVRTQIADLKALTGASDEHLKQLDDYYAAGGSPLPKPQAVSKLKELKNTELEGRKKPILGEKSQNAILAGEVLAGGASVAGSIPKVKTRLPGMAPIANKVMGGLLAADLANEASAEFRPEAYKQREQRALTGDEKYLNGGDVGKDQLVELKRLAYGAGSDSVKAYGSLSGTGKGALGYLGAAGSDLAVNYASSKDGQPYHRTGEAWASIPAAVKLMGNYPEALRMRSVREATKDTGNKLTLTKDNWAQIKDIKAKEPNRSFADIAKELTKQGIIKSTFVDKPSERGEIRNAAETFDKNQFQEIKDAIKAEHPELSDGKIANLAIQSMRENYLTDSGASQSYINLQ